MKSIGRYRNKSSTRIKRNNLRSASTKAERILWKYIRAKQLGVKFRRQYNIDYYIVDFYCHELRLVIELDGWIHDEEEIKRKDKIRDRYLTRKGYTVVRYRNEQIKYELRNVIQDVFNRVSHIKTSKDPSSLP